MKPKSSKKLGAIILAAGRGKRMNLKNKNKTSILLNGKPLISYPVELLEKMEIDPVVIVVGHAKNSVQNALKENNVIYAEQKKRLGTGHAAKSAIPHLPDNISDILVINGDDSYLYTQELLNKLILNHFELHPSITLLTVKIDDPKGLGRIVRNSKKEIIDIVEDKNALDSQKKINEINVNCFIFSINFLKKYLSKIPKNPITGEYYLTSLINLAYKGGEKIEAFDGGHLLWRGINTKEELEEARKLIEN